MPHVIVHFDPKRVDQDVIDKLKSALQLIVANGMSYTSGNHRDVTLDPKNVYVRQQAAHPTDVNPPAIEIEIQAGRRRELNPEGVVTFIIQDVLCSDIIPPGILGSGDCCMQLRFSEESTFNVF